MKHRILIIAGSIILCTLLVIGLRGNLAHNQNEMSDSPSQIQTKAAAHSLVSKIPESLRRPKPKEKVFRETLRVSDLEIPILFGDASSEKLKQFILSDLELLFSHSDYNIYDWAKINPKHVRELILDGKTYKTSKRLRLTPLKAPKIFNKEFGDIIEYDGGEAILFPETMSTEYEKSLSFTERHQREYEQLADFVYMMTEATEETPITLHPSDITYMPGAPALKKLEEDPSLVTKAQKFYSKTTRLRMPSVLEFKSAPLAMQAKGISLTAVAYSLKGETQAPSIAISLVYHDGRWKILGTM